MAEAIDDTPNVARKGASIPVGQRIVRAQRYRARIVGFLKILFPTIAVALTLAVVGWPLLEESQRDGLGFTQAERDAARDIQITNAVYTSVQNGNSPYTVTAKNAKQHDPDIPIIDLTDPKADITWADQTWYAVTAPTGRMNQDTNTLDLWGGVNLFQDQGYEFHTERMMLNFDQKSGYSLTPVEGQGPDIYVSAEGIRVYNMGERIELLGKTKLILRPTERGS
ncbi:LPS export ABC transporter periplasmic protein LptC [Aestuariispira ectoiniformans]|uniref:LPS export ABC transporter periplasmic protein LptC n=1 Tax=Aestuariispira ectoiniformans TaxID=2775080 RepID=UPI00223B850E|nr:LPS export ABC transporter periplasmic protein LptC [Aestuariispira ectoiniformans]